MFISENGLNLIKKYEGCFLQSYDDYNENIVNAGESFIGTGTIGYGHIEGVFAGQTITQQEAEDMLRNDMLVYCNNLDEVINEGAFSFSINQNMYDALTSFGYNLGQGCLRSLGADGSRDKQTVADMMLEYRNKGSVWEQGLLRRRQEERELFLSNDESGIIVQPSYNVSEDPIFKARSFIGNRALELQNLLIAKGYDCGGYGADGKFGNGTYNSLVQFQNDNGLIADGLAGEKTFIKLSESQSTPQVQGDDWVRRLQQECNNQGFSSNQSVDGFSGANTLAGCPTLREGANGEITRLLQEKLNSLGYGTNGIDGDFGDNTASAVAQFQRDRGLSDDAVCGQATWSKLLGLS